MHMRQHQQRSVIAQGLRERATFDHAQFRASDRRDRLVAAVADGDEELGRSFDDVLYDITNEGHSSAQEHFRRIVAELAQERAEAVADSAEAIVGDRAAGFDVTVWAEALREKATAPAVAHLDAEAIVAAAEARDWWRPTMTDRAAVVAEIVAARAAR
jgi:hypothetical protein